MKFLIDEQLPPALAYWLAERGHAAEHVYEVGLMGMSDVEVAWHAIRTGAVMITKDEDFRILRAAEEVPQVLWVRLGNVRNRTLFSRLTEVWDEVIAALHGGETIVTVWPGD